MTKVAAARAEDEHLCPNTTLIYLHIGGKILYPCASKTMIEGKPAARVTDRAHCKHSPPDVIVRGSHTIRIEGKPAAYVGSDTAHGGKVIAGALHTFYGLNGASGMGPNGKKMCQDLKKGRHPPHGAKDDQGNDLGQMADNDPNYTNHQSYNNCGLESTRQFVNTFGGQNISQENFLLKAVFKGDASIGKLPALVYGSGGSFAAQRADLLDSAGISNSMEPFSASALETAVDAGNPAMVTVDASVLWDGLYDKLPPPDSMHIVTVTGIEYDNDGNPANVIINDTGTAQCGRIVPFDKFMKAAGEPGKYLNAKGLAGNYYNMNVVKLAGGG